MKQKGIDSRILDVTASLALPVRMMDLDEEPCPEYISLEDLLSGEPVSDPERHETHLYLAAHHLLLTASDDSPASRDVLRLIPRLASQDDTKHVHRDLVSFGRSMLRGEIRGEDLLSTARSCGIRSRMDRRVLLMVPSQDMEKKTDSPKILWREILDLIPTQERDLLVDMSDGTCVLVKDVSDNENADETVEYAMALQETVLGETGSGITVGISSLHTDVTELYRGYREAQQAIEVGEIYAPGDTVFSYSRLILERLLMQLPYETALEYSRMLFNESTQSLLTDDMLQTIDMFFKKDLQISDAARALYIHRNTLIYRLDKIQGRTGLDLRKFDDAVVFNVLMKLRRNVQSKEETQTGL